MSYTLPQAEQAATIPCNLESPLENLSNKASLLYQALRAVAVEVAAARGYVKTVSQVHFFCPGEIVADACGMARSTMYLKLAELVAAELVEGRAHYVSHNGRTRADGMVWAIKLDAAQPGRVRVPYDALKASYRCLSADIEAGRTAWNEIGQSKADSFKPLSTEKILTWALPPLKSKNLVTGLTVRSNLETVLDLPYIDKDERRGAVDTAARALAVGLGDAGGLMFFRWLCWQLLRLSDNTGANHFYTVYEQAKRAQVDAQEGFARRPGALFTARLKRTPWWDELARASGRVGSRPVN